MVLFNSEWRSIKIVHTFRTVLWRMVYGKTKQCNIMLITLPLQKEIKVGRICQNIMKVDEFKFIALFLEFAKKCLRVFVEWEWDEKSCSCQNVCVRTQLSGPSAFSWCSPYAACFSRSCSRYRDLGFEDDDGKYFLRTEALFRLSFLYSEAQ